MVKTYKFNDINLTKLKETLGDFKVTKLSDIISFLNTEQISKDEDKVYINGNLTFDLKTINHENNINFDFDMEMEIGSGYTFEIINANATDNNIQYININKPIVNKGTIIINHLVCNNSQITNEKKGIIQINSIFYNSLNVSSTISIINNGEFINNRTFYNNSTFINNLTFKHEDKSNIQTYNNKKFENNGTLTILNGEFVIAEKKEEINEEKTPDLLDDNLNTINEEKKETEQTAEVAANLTLTQTTTLDYQTIIDKDGIFKNNKTIEINKGLIKSTGEFKNENGKITIEEGGVEIIGGLFEFSKSELVLNNGSMVLSKGQTDFKDDSTLTINGGEYKMTSGIFNLYDTCKFNVNGGKISLNKSFNIIGGQLSFMEGKYDTDNYKLNLSTTILDTEAANVDQKLNFIIESETVENNVKSLIDDNYVLKTDLEKQIKDLTDSKNQEIENLKEEFVKKHEEKVTELTKQIQEKETEIQKLQEDIQNQKIQISNLETSQSIKQGTKEEIPKVEATTQTVQLPEFVSKVYELSFNYDAESQQITPIIKNEKIKVAANTLTTSKLQNIMNQNEEELNEADEKEVEEIIEDLLDESDESVSKVSKAKEKIINKIKNQSTIQKAIKYVSAITSILRMKVSANYVLKSLLDESYIAQVETIQKKHIKTYGKTINADDTKTVTKYDKKDVSKQVTKYEKPKTQTDVKQTVLDVIDKFTKEDEDEKGEESRMIDEEEEELKNNFDEKSKVTEVINKEKTSEKTETKTQERNRNMTLFRRLKAKPYETNKTFSTNQTTTTNKATTKQATTSKTTTKTGNKKRVYSNGLNNQSVVDTSKFKKNRRFI